MGELEQEIRQLRAAVQELQHAITALAKSVSSGGWPTGYRIAADGQWRLPSLEEVRRAETMPSTGL